MKTIRSSNKTKHTVYLIVFLLIFLSRFFDYKGAASFRATYFVFVGLIFYIWFVFHLNIVKQAIPFRGYVLFLIVWPVFSLLFSSLSEGLLIDGIINILPWTIIASFFFIFYNYHFNEVSVIRILTIFGLLTFCIQIVQQVFPDLAVFGYSEDYLQETGEKVATRNGYYRFFVGNYCIQMFLFFYYLDRFISYNKKKYLLYIIFFAASIYLFLTRQIIVAMLTTSCLGVLFRINKKKFFIYFFVILFVSCFIYFFWDILFGQFISDYKNNSYTTDIRREFILIIISLYSQDPLSAIFGHGITGISDIWKKNGYFLSDIGFLGEGYVLGLIWSLGYFCFVAKIFLKYRKVVPSYIIMYLISTLFVCIFIFPYRSNLEMYLWISMVYLSSLSVQKSKSIQLQNQ